MTRLEPPVCVALDVPSLEDARRVVGELRGVITVFKVGLELFTAAGPAAVDLVQDAGCDVLLDLKVHDVPRTAAAAVSQAASLGVSMMTVHGLGGRSMLRAAVESARECGGPRLLTVTILTSHDEAELEGIGVVSGAIEQTTRIARVAAEEGTDGLVLAPRELAVIRPAFPDLLLATSAVRPQGSPPDELRRLFTPGEAVFAGADLVILGRPVLRAADRRMAAVRVVEEVRAAGVRRESPRAYEAGSSLVDAEDAEILSEDAPTLHPRT